MDGISEPIRRFSKINVFTYGQTVAPHKAAFATSHREIRNGSSSLLAKTLSSRY